MVQEQHLGRRKPTKRVKKLCFYSYLIKITFRGDSVYIPAGQNVLLDVSTPVLFTVIVEGNLVFKDVDLTFDASYVVVRGGSVRIGTWKKPFQSKLTITMHGHKRSKYLPEFGN